MNKFDDKINAIRTRHNKEKFISGSHQKQDTVVVKSKLRVGKAGIDCLTK